MMKNYPNLAEMGVLHPGQIEQFSVHSINYIDVLRITYKRPSGSLLPVVRTYKFPRVKRTINVSAALPAGETVMETNPKLADALKELKQICEKRKHKKGIASAILDEIRMLEEDLAMRGDYIKTLVEQIRSQDE